MHSAVKAVVAFVLVPIAAIAGMAATGFCPPAGSWPQPPWCSGPGQPPGVGSVPFLPQAAYGEAPAVAAGMQLIIPVETSVPVTRDPVTLNLNGRQFPMEKVTDYLYRYAGIPVKGGDE